MSDQRGTTEQQAEQPYIDTEHGYLTLATTAASVGVVLAVIDGLTAEDFRAGLYVGLATLAAVGGCGWLVRSEGTKRRLDNAELLRRVAELPVRCERPVYVSRGVQDATIRMPRVDDKMRAGGRTDVGGPSSRLGYWRVYSDVLEDLGGLDSRGPEG